MKTQLRYAQLLPMLVTACVGCAERPESPTAAPPVVSQPPSEQALAATNESVAATTLAGNTAPPTKPPVKSAPNDPCTTFKQFTDGTSNTLLAGTVPVSQSVPWTKPEDVRFDDSFPSKEKSFETGYCMFADGSIRHIQIQDGLDPVKFRALFTINGGEIDPFKSLYPEGHKFASPTAEAPQDQLRQTEARMTRSNSLKKIALAFHNYHSAFQHLPPAVVHGPDGKPWHSWRVLILPFLGQVDLYQAYDQSVPWDDPKNVAVLEKIPEVYRDPLSDDSSDTRTRYLVITGPGTAFPTMSVIPTTNGYGEDLKTTETKPSNDAANRDALNKKENSDGSSITLTEAEAIEEIKKLGGMVIRSPSSTETSVVFAMTKVTDDGLVHLTSLKDIVSFTLTSNIVTDKGLVHLEGLTGLKKLILSGTSFGDSSLVHLRGLTNLESMSLGGPRFTDAGLVHIQQFSKLESLSLIMTTVTDSGLQAINKMNQLRSLTLMGRFTDAGLAHLKELQNLQTLMLGGTKISDAGLTHLSGLTDLQNLSLNNTAITDAGLIHLSGLKTLTSLNLQKTGISDAGLDRLSEMSKLDTLFLSGTSVTEEGKNKLKKTNTKLKIY
jgi:hypothetical protein